MTGYVHSNLGMEEDDDISESSWNYPIRVSSSLTYPQDPRLSPSSHSFVSPTHVDPTCPCEDGVSSQQWLNENDLRPLSPTPTRYSYVPETQFPSGTSFSKHPAWHPTDDLTEHNHPAGGTEEPFGRYQSKVAQADEGDSCENTQEFPVQGELSNPDLDRSENMAYTPPPPPLPEPTSSTRHVHEAAANQKGRAVICDEAPPLNDIVVSITDTVRREPPIQKGGELKFEESSQCSTGTKSLGPSNSTKPTPLPTFKDLLVTPKRGDVVEAKWNNGRWYQACVQEVNEPSRFVTICFEGRDSPRVALFKEIRPPSTTSVVPSTPRGNNPAIRPPHHGGTAATSTTRLETQVPTKAQDLRPGASSSESTSTTVSPDPFPAPTRMLPGKGSTGTSKASGNQGSLPSRNDSLSSVRAFGPKTTWTPPSAGESVEVRRANGRWGKATVVYVANGLVHATYDETGIACQVPLDQVRSLVGQPLASGSDARPSVSPPLEIITEEQTTSTPEKSVRAVSAAKCKSGDQGKIQHDDAQPPKDSKVENTITKANRSPSQQSRHQNDRVHRASNSRRRIPFVPMVDAPVDVKWRDCKWYPAVVVSVDDVMVRVRYIQVSSWTGDTEELVAMHHVRPRQETSTERREREAEVQQDKKEEWARAQKDAKTKSGRTHDELGSAPNAKRIRTGQSVPVTSLTTNTHSCERQSLDSTIREKRERKSHHKKNHTMDEKPNISLADKKKGQSNASSVFRTPVKVTVEKDQPCGVSVSERPKESNPRGSTMSAEALDMSDGEDEEITSYDGLRVGECYYCDASRVLTHVPVIESNETNRLKNQSTKGRTAPHIPSTTTRSFNDGTGGISRDATCHHRLGRIVGFVIPRHNIPLPEGTVRSPVCWVKLEWLDVNVTFLVHATLRLPLVRPSGETVYVPVEAIDRRVEPIVIAQKNIPHTFLLEAARSS